VIYTSLIYANPHYIPANSIQNVIMAGLHEGAFLPINLTRAGQILVRAPGAFRKLILAEVGQGATDAWTALGARRPRFRVGSRLGRPHVRPRQRLIRLRFVGGCARCSGCCSSLQLFREDQKPPLNKLKRAAAS
jgi:hypothetical protein